MTEYLILNQARTYPVVWEYGKEVVSPNNFTIPVNTEQSHWYLNFGTNVGAEYYYLSSSNQSYAYYSFRTSTLSTNAQIIGSFIRRVRVLWGSAGGDTPTVTLSVWEADPSTLNPTNRIRNLGQFTRGPSGGQSFTWSVDNPLDGVPITLGNAYSVRLGDPVSYEAPTTLWSLELYGAPSSSPSGKFTAAKTEVRYTTDGVNWVTYTRNNRSWGGWEVEVVTVLRAPTSSGTIFRSDEACNLYVYKSQSIPTGITFLREFLNNTQYNLPTTAPGVQVPFPSDEQLTYTFDYITTANVNTQIATTLYPRIVYEKNPVTVDMFNASEAYLIRLEYLATDTRVRLNDSPLQEFTGSSGATTFDPPPVVWKLENLSGRVRAVMMVLE
ncbi:MAG: hypothetical protein NZ920_01270 [Aigarchaeota archaeon]|nr:hypothetical protein [Aigarchaeota archaeon]MDW8093072.1 hypothetical protein [Nitrososphaerota archaeon]